MSYVPFSALNPKVASQYATDKPGNPWLRGYDHANKLYRENNFELAPKPGFIYFVDFNVNTEIKTYLSKSKDQTNIEMLSLAGLLAKTVQMPKFKVATETLNQYNRKTNIQTKLTYEPVRLEFHDDHASNTSSLWQNYYKYYYKDSTYNSGPVGSGAKTPEFGDTKFGKIDYSYGFQNFKQVPFFTSIDIYVLHQGNFTSLSLINPLITGWEHDTLDQTDGTKMLKNSMTIVYEDVFYDKGSTTAGSRSESFSENGRYDKTTSTLNIYGPRSNIGTDKDLYTPDQFKNVKPPATGQLSKALLGLSSTLRAITIARELMNNRKRAWAVYGFNIKNIVTNRLADAVFASAASVTTQSLPPPSTTTVGPNAASNYRNDLGRSDIPLNNNQA
jgi:hypothetical protein